MSNIIILFPNIIILGLNSINDINIFEYLHYLLPGSTLIGILL